MKISPTDRLHQQGFTLTETVVIIAVIGILSAIAGPNLIGWVNQKRVDDALVSVQGAMQQAQSQAIRRSQTCTVTVPEGNNPTVTITPAACLLTGSRQLQNISVNNLATTGNLPVTFNFKGNTFGFDDGTVILSSPNTPNYQRCLVVSLGIGIMRTGDFRNGACVTRR